MARRNEFEVQKQIMEDLESADISVPWVYRWSRISHYYGDSARQLFIAAALVMLIAAPFYTDDLPSDLPYIVVGVIALVVAAAITTPWKKMTIGLDAFAAGVGLIVFEVWALHAYNNNEMLKFVIREVLAVIFLFALYLSAKTLRAMLLHRMGKTDTPRDFTAAGSSSDNEQSTDQIKWRDAVQNALDERNDREKFDSND
jgi:MFS superfamily sulfate permease-like transporter